ncbi:MAG: hypothetical protein Q4E16_03080 [Neisseria sp.]|nr:hypothetical protein [Neisseria sp.]
MSNGLNWADLMSGNFQVKEQEYYLKEEVLNNPEPLITRFMDGLKSYLEKDIQKEILSYRLTQATNTYSKQSKAVNASISSFVSKTKHIAGKNVLVGFHIALPTNNQEKNLFLQFGLRFHCDQTDLKHIFITSLRTQPILSAIEEETPTLGDISTSIAIEMPTSEQYPNIDYIQLEKSIGLLLTKDIDDGKNYQKYFQDSNWEAIYQYIQDGILKHPALKR